MRVGQVRVIFTLPRQFGTYSRALAYIEWFTPLREPDRSSGLHHVSCSTRRLHRNAAVIHVDEIARPCHLIPKMGQAVDHGWTSANVYELFCCYSATIDYKLKFDYRASKCPL
ncbi:hypothetical protein EV702DRAFT_1119554 [Suillus placidus]|uniref:Uncharacterized protein n=1 Tax=Suillus placidus TaxID=48579 RepID=A0A9P6ZS33_9AGAM|nr:hypothetical protein EV702DRAFT_1119551 [Suillus placidus]KAG1775224.1 hypothetical protein EV702DRAFT_1119554 [Suillus placidus]